MIILDTDHLSVFERRESAEAKRLSERLSHVAPEDVATTIISYEEQTRGWMAYLSRAKSVAQEVRAYQKLLTHLGIFREIPVLPFSMKRQPQTIRDCGLCDCAWRLWT